MNLNEKLYAIGIVPVIAIEKIEHALPLAKALIDGGLPVAEITFRSACAKEAIAKIHEAYPEMLIGAGTILTNEQVDDAIEAGASFVVSPGLNPKTVQYCQSKNMPILPGVANASDIEVALGLGLDVVKFFPAEPLGGIKMIKALAAPYGALKFMPTGGINAKNVKEYLQCNKILCCGGSWMVDPTLLANEDFDAIRELTKEAVNTMLDLKLAHVGMNDPKAVAGFEALLGARVSETSEGNIFVGKSVEVTKKQIGTHGHLAYSTTDVKRAVAHYQMRGYAFDEELTQVDEKGNYTRAYLADEIGGFAVHFMKEN